MRFDAAAVHVQYGEYVQKVLTRMGVREPHRDDIYQEVFLVVHRRLGSFHGQCALTTWLYEVCFRVVWGYRRRAYHRREIATDLADWELASSAPTPDSELEGRNTAARVQEALASLKVEQRTVLDLFEIEGFTCEEVSQIMGVPVGTTYSRLSRARKAFGRAAARQRLREH